MLLLVASNNDSVNGFTVSNVHVNIHYGGRMSTKLFLEDKIADM